MSEVGVRSEGLYIARKGEGRWRERKGGKEDGGKETTGRKAGKKGGKKGGKKASTELHFPFI